MKSNQITTQQKGSHISVNRDEQPIGQASRLKGNIWAATAYTIVAPFDRHLGTFDTDKAAVGAIAKVGETPKHLKS